MNPKKKPSPVHCVVLTQIFQVNLIRQPPATLIKSNGSEKQTETPRLEPYIFKNTSQFLLVLSFVLAYISIHPFSGQFALKSPSLRCRTRNITLSPRLMPAPPKLSLSRPAPSVRMVTSSSKAAHARLLKFQLPKQESTATPNVILLQLTFSPPRSLKILFHLPITVMFHMLTARTTS